jgi:hypothetical protein
LLFGRASSSRGRRALTMYVSLTIQGWGILCLDCYSGISERSNCVGVPSHIQPGASQNFGILRVCPPLKLIWCTAGIPRTEHKTIIRKKNSEIMWLSVLPGEIGLLFFCGESLSVSQQFRRHSSAESGMWNAAARAIHFPPEN